MASTPDPHPDSIQGGASDDSERVTPADGGGRESVEDSPGNDGGTSGTGGTNHRDDREVTS